MPKSWSPLRLHRYSVFFCFFHVRAHSLGVRCTRPQQPGLLRPCGIPAREACTTCSRTLTSFQELLPVHQAHHVLRNQLLSALPSDHDLRRPAQRQEAWHLSGVASHCTHLALIELEEPHTIHEGGERRGAHVRQVRPTQ